MVGNWSWSIPQLWAGTVAVKRCRGNVVPDRIFKFPGRNFRDQLFCGNREGKNNQALQMGAPKNGKHVNLRIPDPSKNDGNSAGPNATHQGESAVLFSFANRQAITGHGYASDTTKTTLNQ